MRTARPRSVKPADVPRETKNWSVVLSEGCSECDFSSGGLPPDVAAGRIRSLIRPWQAVLRRADAAVRPTPVTWSPVEYACHVRDLCRLVPARVAAVVSYHEPVFENWDQDHAAVEYKYWLADPARLGPEFDGWARAAASVLDSVPEEQWTRGGRRSDGVRFTVTTLGANLLHEVEHHLRDAGGGTR